MSNHSDDIAKNRLTSQIGDFFGPNRTQLYFILAKTTTED
jgi:hypothetical protein